MVSFIILSVEAPFLSIVPQGSPGPNIIKIFTVVIYSHSMVILSFCVTKQHCLGNYCRMAVNLPRYLCNQCYKAQFNLKQQ
jgi:hypothetical protein